MRREQRGIETVAGFVALDNHTTGVCAFSNSILCKRARIRPMSLTDFINDDPCYVLIP